MNVNGLESKTRKRDHRSAIGNASMKEESKFKRDTAVRNKADSMASKTRNVAIICAFISIALFGVGLVVGYINGETAAKRHRSTAFKDSSARSCFDPKWSEKETRRRLALSNAIRAETLVSTDELQEYINSGSRGLRVLDTTHLPSRETTPSFRQQYEETHIPTSLFFDVWQCVKDGNLIGPGLPDKDCFEEYVMSLGIDADTNIVVYDRLGWMISTYQSLPSYRIWWMFRLYGHRNVSILDGGFPKWVKDGHMNSTQIPHVQRTTKFKVKWDINHLREYDDVLDAVVTEKAQIIDSREFNDVTLIDSESNGGYIPCTKFLPFTSLFQEDGTLRPSHQLLQLFNIAGIDLDKPIISSCQIGYAATIMAGTLHMLGVDVPVYVGSWADWKLKADEKYKMRIQALESEH